MSTTGPSKSSVWESWVVFAGLMLVVVGSINAIQGLAAILKHTVYAVPASDLLVATDYKAWGWTLLVWGIVMALAGAGLFSGKTWSRWFGITVVVINLIGQFAWFPAFPLWSMAAIALDIGILFALTVHWQDVREDLRGLGG